MQLGLNGRTLAVGADDRPDDLRLVELPAVGQRAYALMSWIGVTTS